MYKINSMLMCDFYKSVHRSLIPKNMTKSVSYYTPRKSSGSTQSRKNWRGIRVLAND